MEAISPVARGRWHKTPARALRWVDWGGDSVVYDDFSGATYQFAPLAAAVMAFFEEDARSLDELLAAVAEELQAPADNELRSALIAIADRFRGLGWIEPLPSPT